MKTDALVCFNCGERNLEGPFKLYDANLRIDWSTHVKPVALVCMDCGYTIFFTEENERKKIRKESKD
ncbi:MAG: hypothetical protein ACFFF9_05305 [Candidatus Thorarchaeota archaeon]